MHHSLGSKHGKEINQLALSHVPANGRVTFMVGWDILRKSALWVDSWPRPKLSSRRNDKIF